VHPSGHRPDEQPNPVRVEVDGSRLVRVEIEGLGDSLRDPAALGAAFDRAYDAALVADRPPAPADLVASGVRPAGPVVMGRPPLPEVPSGPHWDLINLAGADLGPLSAEGRSDNDCLLVRLDPGSSRGRIVEVDPGWLRQANASRLTAAIHQAFDRAYETKER
jgi:hypothetical protein